MVSWLIFAMAHAAPPTEPRTFQWRPHELLSQSSSHSLIKAGSQTELRLDCPTDHAPPTRQAIIRSSGDPAALAAGPWGTAQLMDDYWYFPPAPLLSSFWLIDAPDCQIQSLSSRVSSAGFARLEHLASNEAELMTWLEESSFLSPAQLDWLASAPDRASWRSRYLAIRPPGPHPTGRISQEGTVSFEGELWISAPDEYSIELPPHQRHHIKAVFLGPRTAGCIYLNQEAHCQANKEAEQWSLSNSEPRLEIKRWEGLSVSKTHRWMTLSGSESQTLTIDGPVLLQLSSTFPQNYLWKGTPDAAVYPPSDIDPRGESIEDAETWLSVPALNAAPLFMMEELETITTASSAWFDLDSLRGQNLTADQWIDDSGAFSIWIPHDPSHPRCSIQLQGRRHSIMREESKVHRFLWLSDIPPTELPILDGCSGKLRVLEPAASLAHPTLRRQYQEMPAEGLYFNIDADRQSWLRFTHTPETASTTLRLEQRSGRAQNITIRYLTQHNRLITDDQGQEWRRPISLQLDTGWDGLMLHSLSPTRARISQIQPTAELPAPDDLALPELPQDTDLYALTQLLQRAQNPEAQVRVLEKRALMLASLGEDQLALLDMRIADTLRSETQLILGDLQSQRLSKVLYPHSDWRPTLDDWIEDSLSTPLSDALLSLAVEERYLEVAEGLTAQGLDARYWWRKAMLKGTEVSRHQAITAYQQDLMFSSLTSEQASYFWPLRSLSYDVPIYVRPRGIRHYKGDWPEGEASAESDPASALFEEAFPPNRRRLLNAERSLIIPPLQESQNIALHCRPKSSRGDWGRCAIEITTVDGSESYTLESDIWGTTAELELPPSTQVRQVTVPNDAGLLMELRLPETDTQPHRSAWELRHNRPSTFSVLGPTVLRLDTWSFDAIETTLLVTIQGENTTAEHSLNVVGAQQHRLVISEAGAVNITLQSPAAMRVKPFVRDSEGGQFPEPDPEAEAIDDFSVFVTDSREALLRVPASPARPFDDLKAQRLLLSTSGSPVKNNSHSLEWTYFQRIPETTRWWSAGFQAHQYINRQPVTREGPLVLDAHAGMDWLKHQGAYNLWLIADADAGLSLSEPLAARERLNITARADRWWRAYLQSIVRFRAQQYAQLAPHPEPYISIADSTYLREHPYQLNPEAELRLIPSPFLRLQWKTGLSTNSFGDATLIDQWYGTAMINVGAPQRWLRLYTDLEQRLPDSNRLVQQQSIAYGSMVHAGFWVRKDRLLEGRIRFETNPTESEWFVQTQLSLVRSSNRLNAIRPTQLAMRHAMNWGFDDANNRYWGIAPPTETTDLEEVPD